MTVYIFIKFSNLYDDTSRRCKDVDFFPPEVAAVSAMRIEGGRPDARLLNCGPPQLLV